MTESRTRCAIDEQLLALIVAGSLRTLHLDSVSVTSPIERRIWRGGFLVPIKRSWSEEYGNVEFERRVKISKSDKEVRVAFT